MERPLDRHRTVDDFDTRSFTRARENAGHTQSSLAREAGVSPSMVSAVERGAKAPSVALAGRLAAALGVPLEQLRREPVA